MTTSRGFTLIELLMVVAIIGILSSVVLSSLQTARLKSADATVRQEANQLRTIMEQERTNSGTYTAIKSGGVGTPGPWIDANSACGTFTGQFATQAALVCKKLVAAASVGSSATAGCGASDSCVFFQTTSPNSTTKYSIMAYLPYASIVAGAGRWICVGSSGGQSVADGAAWVEDGCQSNP